MTCVSCFKFKLDCHTCSSCTICIFFATVITLDIATFPVSMNLRRVLILGKKSLFRRLLLCYGHTVL